MLGAEYDNFKAHFSVQSPIEIENGVLKTTGCEAHNCGGNMYYLFVDLKGDNINIFHFVDDQPSKHYFENGEINLPKKFSDDLATFSPA